MFYKCLYCRSFYGELHEVWDHILNNKCPRRDRYIYEYDNELPQLNYVIIDNSKKPKVYDNYLYL